MQIYIHRNNQQLGPFTEAEVKAQLASGAISLQDHVWWQGQANWMPLGQSPLAATLSSTSPGSAPMVPSPLPGTTAVAYTTVQEPSKLAIWALVCGCLTLLCGLLASIPAIILGHLALGEIKKNPNRTGRGMALAGLIIGYVMTLLSIGAIALYISMAPAILEQVKEAEKKSEVFTPGPSTNAPEQTAPASATTNSPDQSTNSAPATTNSPDSSTNSSAPSTNATDSSTNAAPMNQ
jgi:hypothetical protein